MSKPWQISGNNRLTCPPSANVGSLHISCGYLGNGDFGPTGPTGPTPDGDCYGDYLYWDNTTNSWAVGSEKINLGCGAGQFNQGDKSVAIGYEAGFTGQTLNSVAIGNNAGHFRQGDTGPGNTGNTGNAVAIGNLAGEFNQGANAVAIGILAGQTGQQEYSVAIGRQSGTYGQNYEAVAIGNVAGHTGQNIYGIAIGSNAGADNQGQYSIAIGRLAGEHKQGEHSIAIGKEAGHTGSGQPGQGNYAVAIGYRAGYTNQHNNTIVLNASGNELNTAATDAFYVKTIRDSPGPNSLYYNNNTGEITHSNNNDYLLKTGGPMTGAILMNGTTELRLGTNPVDSNGMRMYFDSGKGYLDLRGTEFQVRTNASANPSTSSVRFKVNDTNTTVINNFFVDGNTTLGNNVAVDKTTFNSEANFPSGSELKFNSGSNLLFQSGATTTFNSISSSLYNPGAILKYANVQTFLTGSYIDGARIRIIPSGNTSFQLGQLGNLNLENGVYCNNTNPITITMPNKQANWNNRHYIIKVLGQNVDIDPPTGVKIDDSTNTINVGGSYRSFQFAFTSDFESSGLIYIIGDK
jgi:hypothetical protein